jgi:hypothetical protein
LSHLAVSSPRRVVPIRQASRLDEQVEKSGWRCDEPGHSAWATGASATRMAGIAAAMARFGMVRSYALRRSAALFAPGRFGR